MNSKTTCALALIGLLAVPSVNAGDASWMEDHADKLKDLTLQDLSVPASHDAGMYTQDVDEMEISIEDLHFEVVVAGATLIELPSRTGVMRSGDLLVWLDQLMSIVNPFDEYCIEIADVDLYCFGTGIGGAVANWVDEYYHLAKGIPGELSITQDLDLYGQLSTGVRMFDLRPKKHAGDMYLHHSQANLKDLGGGVDWSYDLEFYVPCVEGLILDCILGTDEWYDFGTFAFRAGGEIKAFSSTGPRVSEVVADVASFLQEGHKELVVLEFTGFWADFNGAGFDNGDYEELLSIIETHLRPWMLTSDMVPEDRLADTNIQELIGDTGRVIVLVETDDFEADPVRGFWEQKGSVFDSKGTYSNTESYDDMRTDQESNWVGAHDDRFELWWTLTCQFAGLDSADCSVRDNAAKANPHLQAFVNELTIPNASGNYINEIWVDFPEDTAATAIAIRMNPWTIPITIQPGSRFGNLAIPGDIFVVVYSSPGQQVDALQLDGSTLMLGQGQARPLSDKVVDMNGDGLSDRLIRFSALETAAACGDDSMHLTGKLFDGQNIAGDSRIKVIGCPDPKAIFDSGGGGLGLLSIGVLCWGMTCQRR